MPDERIAELDALRRVATLVARQSPSEDVLEAVAGEVGRLLGAEDTAMFRFEDDAAVTLVAAWGKRESLLQTGRRLALGGDNVTARVRRTGRPARIDDYDVATGAIGTHMRGIDTGAAVGCPIVVNGRLWGVMIAAQRAHAPLPPDTEARIERFTELISTAISNVQAREDLAASRARVVAAADEERRRVVRDLHDGAQQRLVHTIITLQQALSAERPETMRGFVAAALEQARRATAELRELAQGLHPAVLIRGGLRAGVDELADRMPVPVEVAVEVERLEPDVEAAAYFVVAEALTNVAKHARAARVSVAIRAWNGRLRIEVRDDGAGGAAPGVRGGLVGLADRLAVLDGTVRVESAPGAGTLVAAEIPLG
jgi:signal transduction histidine kinase